MPRKKKIETPKNPIEIFVEEAVKEALDKKEFEIKKEDAEIIVQAMLPEIEKMVSKIVLKHFKALALYAQTKLKDPEEK